MRTGGPLEQTLPEKDCSQAQFENLCLRKPWCELMAKPIGKTTAS